MSIHILGNGPSIQYFDRDVWPETDVFVGCNFSDTRLCPNYTVIVDVRAMKAFCRYEDPYRLTIPAVLSQRAYDYIEKDAGGWNTISSDLIRVIDVMPLERDRRISKNLAMNSGQHAAVYSIRNSLKQREVHIWGTDSFWSDDLKSTTDAIVRQERRGFRSRPQITRQWNGYWHKIFSEHADHEFVIHRPHRGVELVSGFADVSNVRVVDEKP